MENAFPPEDCLITPGELSSHIYRQIIILLSEDNGWKKIALSFKAVNILSDEEFLIMSQCALPAERLLQELGSRLCDVGTLCTILEQCGLYRALMLFRPHQPINIDIQPYGSGDGNSLMIERGHEMKLMCRASGLPPPSYQWNHGNEYIPGATQSILLIPNFRLEDEGEYYCIISQDGYSRIASNMVIASMAPEHPVLTQQPRSLMVCRPGTSLNLSVRAVGHPKLSYQWYHERRQMDGCTEPDLVINVMTENEEGNYRCYVSNAAGEVWTKPSNVTVFVSPDDFHDPCQRPQAAAKVALLIGNQEYLNMSPLHTPEEDVRTLAEILMQHDFQVLALQNLSLIEMRNAVKELCKILPEQAYVVFYFAGHGFEMKDKFMLPVSAPGPDSYLKADALSEGELLRDILDTHPQVFVEILDMCLKSPESENKAIFQEVTELHKFTPNNNLIQGYSTTSHLGAYERKADKNGLFVKFLKPYLLQDISMVAILAKVARDMEKECAKQMPYRGTNVTKEFRLTDPCGPCDEVKKKIETLNKVPEIQVLRLSQSQLQAVVTSTPYLGVYCNALQATFTNLQAYKASCETSDRELGLSIERQGKDLVITVKNIQRLRYPQSLHLELQSRESGIVETTEWLLGKPLIAVCDLWMETKEPLEETEMTTPQKQ